MSIIRSFRDRPKAGFLLVEALVALAITGLLMVVLLRSYSTLWGEAARAREDAEAMLLARSVLEAKTPRLGLVVGGQEGRSGPYAWTISIARLGLVPNWTLFRVRVVVTTPKGRRTVLETDRLGRSAS
jgi:hypothetical protein